MGIDRKTFPLPLDAVLDNAGSRARERDERHRARVSAGISALKDRASGNGRIAPSVVRPGLPPIAISGNGPAAVTPAVRQGLPSGSASGPLRSGAGVSPDRARQAMVARLRDAGVNDARVLNALGQVPRHLFIDSGFAGQAYEDAALPIGYQQTISKPSIVARKLELLCRAVPPGQRLGRVLEIGTGCGYQAAVLSLLAQDVYSIERIRALHDKAKSNLRPLRIPNLRLHYGDGMQGLPQAAPFDAIIVAAAGLEIPPGLLGQIADGGRLVAPVTAPDGRTQRLQLIERERDRFVRRELEAVFFVPLKSGTI